MVQLDLEFVNKVFPAADASRHWKNAFITNEVLKFLLSSEAEGFKPGIVFTTSQLEEVIRKLGYDKHWDLSANPGDEFGLRRSLGDIVGGHGLRLRRKGKGYIVPKAFPVVDKATDTIVKEAVY